MRYGRERRSRATRLYDFRSGLVVTALSKPAPGFYCTACRSSLWR
jgi:hypothetical protein